MGTYGSGVRTVRNGARVDRPSVGRGDTETGNQLLDALPPAERERIVAHARPRWTSAGEVLFDAGRRADAVWFPVSAVVSILTVLEDGSGVEIATIGREGVVGVFVFLGDDRSPNGRAVVQMAGEVLEVDADAFRSELGESGKLGGVLQDYTRALLLQVSQSVACSAAHPVRARLARWLLQTTDRVRFDDIRLTQQFLSEILHTRRASITEAVGALEAAGAVRRRRGAITVSDREALEYAACECYAIVRREYARLVPGE